LDSWQRFYFMRHGETDWNAQKRFQGRFDIPLNAAGLEQAHTGVQILMRHKFHRIITSPMLRALKTAEIVGEHVNLPIQADGQLHERDFGAFDGLVIDDVKRQHGVPLNERITPFLPPDAEQWSETIARSRDAIGKWLTKFPEETILFVAHHGILAGLSQALTGKIFTSEHAIPYEIFRRDEGWQIEKLG